MGTTKIEQLRRRFANEINLVDVIKFFDPTKNRVLTPLLINAVFEQNKRLFRDQKYHIDGNVTKNLYFDGDKDEALDEITHNYLVSILIENVGRLLDGDTAYYLRQFRKYWDENKLSHDMSEYKTIDDIKNVVHIIDIKEFTKSQLVQIYRIYEDETWLMALPLSLKASQIYGAGTKWCTTNRDNDYQYFEYTHRGLLVYMINKVNNHKYAYYRTSEITNSPGDRLSQFFNATDVFVDSMDLDIPDFILAKLREFVKTTLYKSNSEFPNYLTQEYAEYIEKQELGKKCEEAAQLRLAVTRTDDTIPQEAPARGDIVAIMEENPEENVPQLDPATTFRTTPARL